MYMEPRACSRQVRTFVESEAGWPAGSMNTYSMCMLPLATLTGRLCHWAVLSLGGSLSGWFCHWVALSLGGSVTGWLYHWVALWLCHWVALSVTDALSGQGAGRKEPNKACRLVVYEYVRKCLNSHTQVYECVIPLVASVLIPTHRVYEYVILLAVSVLIPTHRVY